MALGAEASFVARTMDSDRQHMVPILKAAAEHRGAAFVEIYQNCPIFNDGAFDMLKDRTEAATRILRLNDGEEVTAGDQVVVRADDGSLTVVPRSEAIPDRIVRHNVSAQDPAQAFGLSRIGGQALSHVAFGVFRDVERPAYDDLVRSQVEQAVDAAGGAPGPAELAALIAGRDTWSIGG